MLTSKSWGSVGWQTGPTQRGQGEGKRQTIPDGQVVGLISKGTQGRLQDETISAAACQNLNSLYRGFNAIHLYILPRGSPQPLTLSRFRPWTGCQLQNGGWSIHFKKGECVCVCGGGVTSNSWVQLMGQLEVMSSPRFPPTASQLCQLCREIETPPG